MSALSGPEFKALLAGLESRLEEQRCGLAEAGMLLTPGELLDLKSFGFDAFAEDMGSD